MPETLKVLLAGADPPTLLALDRALTARGCSVVGPFSNESYAVTVAAAVDVAVIDVRRSPYAALVAACEAAGAPILYVSTPGDPSALASAALALAARHASRRQDA